MMNYAVVALAVASLGASVLAVKLPNGWITCKMDDPKHNECMRKAIQRTLPDLLKGIPKLQIGTIDPFHFNEIKIEQGNGPVSIKLYFDGFDVMGIKDGIVQKVENDNWKRITAFVTVPTLTAKGKYKIDGKILVLPITGQGDGVLVLDNFNATITVDFTEETRGGKTYYKMEKMKMDLACDPFKMNLENLFNGNKQLGDQMQIFLNENWREVWNELKGSLAAIMSEAFKDLSNRLFSKIPKSEITPTK